MPFLTEHSARIINPDEFQNDPFGTGNKFARINITDGVDAIIGKLRGEETTTIQSYRFDASKFTEGEAKEWLADRNINYILFEESISNNAPDDPETFEDEIELPDISVQETMNRKLNNPYNVKYCGGDGAIKDIDLKKNIIIGYGNFWNYFDSDEDVLFPGVIDKSLNERGPQSSTKRKIAYCYQHDIKRPIGRYMILKDDGLGAYYEARMSAAEHDILIKVQEGILEQNSIGFNYVWNKIKWVSIESPEFKFYSDKIININDVIQNGGFYGVFEVELWEMSLVTQGANELSQVFGLKGKSKPDQLKILNDKINKINKVLRKGKYNDDFMYNLEIELKQIGSLATSLILNKEPNKITLKTDEPKKINFSYLAENFNIK